MIYSHYLLLLSNNLFHSFHYQRDLYHLFYYFLNVFVNSNNLWDNILNLYELRNLNYFLLDSVNVINVGNGNNGLNNLLNNDGCSDDMMYRLLNGDYFLNNGGNLFDDLLNVGDNLLYFLDGLLNNYYLNNFLYFLQPHDLMDDLDYFFNYLRHLHYPLPNLLPEDYFLNNSVNGHRYFDRNDDLSLNFDEMGNFYDLMDYLVDL